MLAIEVILELQENGVCTESPESRDFMVTVVCLELKYIFCLKWYNFVYESLNVTYFLLNRETKETQEKQVFPDYPVKKE